MDEQRKPYVMSQDMSAAEKPVQYEERLRWLEIADSLPRHATVSGRQDDG